MGKARNTGIDLLRITSMFLVLLLHILGQGALSAAVPFTANYFVGWFLDAAAFCAVNCYALITGYVMFESRFRVSRLIALWFQVVFYAVVITLGYWVILPQTVGRHELVSMFFPVSNLYYWYFTAYFAMYFFIPVLNLAVKKLNRFQLKLLLCAIVVLLTIVPSMMQIDLFQTHSGYSPIWLMAMYLIGAYIKKYGIGSPQKRLRYLGIHFLCSALVWGSKILLDWHASLPYGPAGLNSGLLIDYTSPLILAAAVGLFLFFSTMRICSPLATRCIGLLAPVSFGVYLIHTHPLVWWNWLDSRFVGYAALTLPGYLAAILLTALSIYAVCTLADYLRLLLFRLCKIPALSEKLEGLGLRIAQRLLNRKRAAQNTGFPPSIQGRASAAKPLDL